MRYFSQRLYSIAESYLNFVRKTLAITHGSVLFFLRRDNSKGHHHTQQKGNSYMA